MYYSIPISPLPQPVSVYDISRQTFWHCADERNILLFILDGCCSFNILNQDMELNKGDALLIPADQEYHRRPLNDRSCRFVYIHFLTRLPIEAVSKDLFDCEMSEMAAETRHSDFPETSHVFLPQIIRAEHDFDKIENLLTLLLQECQYNGRVNEILSASALAELLLILEKAAVYQTRYSAPSPSEETPEVFQQAIRFIHSNYTAPISLNSLCHLTNVSPQHIIRLFRKNLNTSPVEYINRVRILHAIRLLGTSNLTIEEISYKLGFASPGYFSRVFKKYNGNSPREERNRILTYVAPENEETQS